jgi:hypothetical protein
LQGRIDRSLAAVLEDRSQAVDGRSGEREPIAYNESNFVAQRLRSMTAPVDSMTPHSTRALLWCASTVSVRRAARCVVRAAHKSVASRAQRHEAAEKKFPGCAQESIGTLVANRLHRTGGGTQTSQYAERIRRVSRSSDSLLVNLTGGNRYEKT